MGKAIGLAIIGLIVMMVVVKFFNYPHTWNLGGLFTGVQHWFAGTQSLVGSPTSWVILAVILIAVSMLLKAPWNKLAILPLVMLIIIGLSPFLDRTGEWIDRTVNHGDWSVSSDYEPRTLYGGTVTFTRIGQVEEFYAKGEVQLLNQIFSQGSCLAISPISKFSLYSLEGNRKNFLTPRSGEKEWVMVEARRAGTCPNPQT